TCALRDLGKSPMGKWAVEARSLCFFRQPFAFAIKSPELTRRQASDSELGNLIEDRIDRSVNVIRFRRAGGTHFGDNVELRPRGEACFQCLPPGKVWSGAMDFNEKERRANACPNDHQVAPGVICEQLKRVNGSKYEHNPFGHDPQKQLSPRINSGEGNKNSKVQRRRTGKSRTVPQSPDGE